MTIELHSQNAVNRRVLNPTLFNMREQYGKNIGFSYCFSRKSRVNTNHFHLKVLCGGIRITPPLWL